MTLRGLLMGATDRFFDRLFDGRGDDLREVRIAARRAKVGARKVSKAADQLLQKAQEMADVAATIRGGADR